MNATRITVVRRRTLLIISLVVLLAIAVIISWKCSGWSTIVKVYNPTGFRADEVVPGSCWTGSLAAQRAGAFRCTADNSIYDPCFSTDSSVACPIGEPDKNKGVMLTLTEPLPTPPEAWENPPDLDNPQPWYMELAGGGICGVLTGTRPPDYPLGCTIPNKPQEAFNCSFPMPTAGHPDRYAAVCGTWQPETAQITDEQIYNVTKMWL